MTTNKPADTAPDQCPDRAQGGAALDADLDPFDVDYRRALDEFAAKFRRPPRKHEETRDG